MPTSQAQTIDNQPTLFGHPRGLATLFFTEMWERFSYYGMRAILILFMVADTAHGGLGFSIPKASAILGLYLSSVYGMSVPGGWVADRFLGLRRAVFWGGILIAAGNLLLMGRSLAFFYAGLALIVFGTGLLKPNVSTIVGKLYAAGDNRRDSGFSIFYMGINLGAFIAPLIVGTVGQRINWRWGFGLSAVGMILGLIQYVVFAKSLGDAGREPVRPATASEAGKQRRTLVLGLLGAALVVGIPILIELTGLMRISVQQVSNAFGLILTLVVVVAFGGLLLSPRWTTVERRRLFAVLVLFTAAALFWSLFEQAASTLTLFAERNTRLSTLGHSFPASWFQSVQPILIILLAPVFAWVWLRLGKRDPSSPVKFAIGLWFAGLGFLILVGPSAAAQAGIRVSPMWLCLTYLLHTIGELSLSPVGLSAMTRLAPERIAGFIMGIWFLSISVGEYLGGRMSALYASMPLPTLFGVVGGFAVACAVVLALFAKPIHRLMTE